MPNEAIRPFRVNISEKAIDDMRRRIAATRFPERETVADNSQGVPLATIQNLARYWEREYDWRKVEKRMNAHPNFLTEIDGLDIHFIHARSKHENALPIIIAHGWPGTIIEQLKIVDRLTNPTAYGGDASDAFHVVIPSMPGYGFSGKPTTTGWDPVRVARAWVVLMKRLGYIRYVAQGTDWGALVTDQIGLQAPPELLGIHTNMPGAVPEDLNQAAVLGAPAPAGLSADEQRAYEQLVTTYQIVPYAYYMAWHPQTMVSLTDSPIGLAAFLFDPFMLRSLNGQREGLSWDDFLDSASLFWLTNTGVSAARLYRENKLPYFTPKGVKVPVAVSACPDELFQCPRSWAELAYPELIYYNQMEKGGHFPAWGQPEIFSQELRAAFKSLRGA